jgi:hypothetical protein
MAEVRVTNRVNGAYIRRLSRPGGPVERFIELRATYTQTAAKQRLREYPQRIDTGLLINSIQIRVFYRGGVPVARIGTDVEYSIYVHEGTRYMEANPFLRVGLERAMRAFG